jgi:hypothetical protein
MWIGVEWIGSDGDHFERKRGRLYTFWIGIVNFISYNGCLSVHTMPGTIYKEIVCHNVVGIPVIRQT